MADIRDARWHAMAELVAYGGVREATGLPSLPTLARAEKAIDAYAAAKAADLQAQVTQLEAADAALHEVAQQVRRWKIPMPEDNPGVWVLKIVEEVGEFSAALLGQELGKTGRGDVLEELNQVIAVALTIRAALKPREEERDG